MRVPRCFTQRSSSAQTTSINEEATAPDITEPVNQLQYEADLQKKNSLLARLTRHQRMQCAVLHKIRLFEKGIYDRKIKNMA